MEPEKARLVKDIEFRVLDEVQDVEYIKANFMKLLQERALEEREVRYSELQYDESNDLLLAVMEEFQGHQLMQEMHRQLDRIYSYRLADAEKDTLVEMGQPALALNSEVFGNILERQPFFKDMLSAFHNRVLPLHLRKHVWKTLLRHNAAEDEYLDMMKNNRWKTVSKNEVEIAQKCVKILMKQCPSLAYDGKIANTLRVVLGYIECIIHRRLPEFMYYIVVPIVYTLTDNIHNIPRMVGICIRIGEIQGSVFHYENTDIATVFINAISELDKALASHIKKILDLTTEIHKGKLSLFIKAFISRLSCSYLSLDTTCFIYDLLIINNTIDKMFYLLGVCMMVIKKKLLKASNWDRFVHVFVKEAVKIEPSGIEKYLDKIPPGIEIEKRQAAPDHLKGNEYLDYLLQAYDVASQQFAKKAKEMGEIYSVQRLIASNPFVGVQYQKALKGNLANQILDQTGGNKRNNLTRRETLLHSNVQSMGHSIIKQLTKVSDSAIREDYSPNQRGTKDFTDLFNKESAKNMSNIREDVSLNNSLVSKFPQNISQISHKPDEVSEIHKNKKDFILDMSDSPYKKNEPRRTDKKQPSVARPKPNINEPKNTIVGPRSNEKKTIFPINQTKARQTNVEPKRSNVEPKRSNAEPKRSNAEPRQSGKQNSISPSPVRENPEIGRDELPPGVQHMNQPPPEKSFLAAGLLGIPDVEQLRPSVFDSFSDFD